MMIKFLQEGEMKYFAGKKVNGGFNAQESIQWHQWVFCLMEFLCAAECGSG